MSSTNTDTSPPTLVSTSALAKRLDLPVKAVFGILRDRGWIERIGEHWRLTGKGQFEGGDYVKSKKYGEYIGWPEATAQHPVFDSLLNRPLSAQSLGAECGISAQRCNALLTELGWQTPFHQGWSITSLGKSLGGLEQEDAATGIPYTVWPKSLLEHPQLLHAIHYLQPLAKTRENNDTNRNTQIDGAQQTLGLESPRENTGPFLCMDGHLSTHREDFAVDNWLYVMGVAHAYQRSLADDALGCADFYIPAAHLHIECWHSQNNAKALSQKLARIDYYKDSGLAYIELSEEDCQSLDQVLPRQLRKHGITLR